jgi:sensor histidine kinase YesM
MVFLEMLGILIAMVLLVLLLTQVIMPFLLSTPFFPMFRTVTPLLVKVEEAEHELEEKTELYRLQKRLFDLNQEQAALEQKIVEVSAVKS